MSHQASSWVEDHAPVTNPTEMLILYTMANHANPQGKGVWVSQANLAEKALCTVRTVQRHLAEMERRGLVIRGDQRQVEHIRKDRRPVVWDLNMAMRREPAGRQNVAPSRDDDTSPVTERHDTGDAHDTTPVTERGDTAVSYKPSENHQYEPSENPPIVPPPGDRFDEFWSLVPRKAGIGKARTAYRNAVKRAGNEQTVIDGMRRFANDPNLPAEKQYIPHPATWLNGDRWEDEPLPPRLSTLPAESRRVAGTRPEDWDRLFDQPDQPAQGDYIDAEVVTDPWAEIEA